MKIFCSCSYEDDSEIELKTMDLKKFVSQRSRIKLVEDWRQILVTNRASACWWTSWVFDVLVINGMELRGFPMWLKTKPVEDWC